MRFSEHLRPAVLGLAAFTALTGIVYPLLVTGIAATAFPRQSGGSLVRQEDVVIGSELIGQAFTSPRYFWGRPSATSPVAYNAGASSGSNLGNASPALLEAVRNRSATLLAAHSGDRMPIPIDLVTASASGLDPHIRPEAAFYQVERVARARGRDATEVRELVARRIEGRTWGLWGEPRVNVLLLNLALDRLAG